MPFYRTLGEAEAPTPPPKKGVVLTFLDNLLDTAGKVASTATKTMDAVGQVKARTKTLGTTIKKDAQEVQTSWKNNIKETPRDTSDDWIKGIPNVAVIAGAGGLLLVLMMSKRQQ